MAGDLRRIATVLMITTDLERMGDLARHIGEAQVTNAPDWTAFEEAELVAWLATLTKAPDGTVMGGRPL